MKRCVAAVLGMSLVMALGFATMVHADDYKSFGVRMRAIYVMPDEDVDGRLNGVKLGDNIIPEVDLEYFFLKNVSTELIAGVTKHDIRLNGTTQGSTWLLPPTLTIKFHPLAGSTISPYIGAGVNVTFPFETRSNLGKTSIDNSVGWAAQAGADFKIAENMYFNLDYKYVNVDTKISLADVAGGTKMKLDINPHLFGIGVGYRF
jgi:outer membrane protein